MAFILADQRGNDVGESFRLYQEYLRANESFFPKSAYALATSDWYWDFTISGCPQDGWLQRLLINETAERNRTVEITIELLGPYHDGVIEFHYPKVYGYRLEARDPKMGHRDWRFDEFRLDNLGNLIHEIEWSGAETTARSLIIASDVEYKWSPLSDEVKKKN